MAGRGTPHAIFRMPPDEWAAFRDAALAAGTDRAELLRAFIAWWMRKPDARLPERPPAPR